MGEDQGKIQKTAAPDGGYGWVVLLASLFTFMCFSGTFASYGIFLPEFLETFHCTKAEVAVITALSGGASGVSGLFLGPLVQRFGSKGMALIGSCSLALGIIASSFAPNLYMLYVTYGILVGGYVALQFTVLGDITPMSHMAVAASLLVATSGLSGLALYPLAGWFADVTGKYGTPFLIYGGLQIIGGIISCVIHVLHRRQRRKKREALKTIDETMGNDDEADVGEEMVVIKGGQNEFVESVAEKLTINDNAIQSEKLLTKENGV